MLGEGNYGETWIARNLNKKEGEVDYYAIKIMKEYDNNKNDFFKEVECLIDIYEICSIVGILCFHESFIMKNGKKTEYVIVTELLDGYVLLGNYLFDQKTKKPLLISRIKTENPEDSPSELKHKAEKIAENIYSQIVDVKNALTSLCISHADLHMFNIMYNPITKNIKVIDLGRCKTPLEEIEEWISPYTRDYHLYSDYARLRQLREVLYNCVNDSPNILTEVDYTVSRDYFSNHVIKVFDKKCVRKKGPQDMIEKYLK